MTRTDAARLGQAATQAADDAIASFSALLGGASLLLTLALTVAAWT